MKFRRVLAGLVVAGLSAALLAVGAPSAQASGRCGDNFHSVGRGPVDMEVNYPDWVAATLDVQYNHIRSLWCFQVMGDHSSVFTEVKGKYNSRDDWHVFDSGWGWSKVVLFSNGGKCVDARAWIAVEGFGYDNAEIQRCRV